MDKFTKYDMVVSCLFEVLNELREEDGRIAIHGLELHNKCDRAILEVAHMVESVTTKQPIYLEMGRFEFFKNRLLKRFKKFEVERINQYLPTKNMRGGILYRTSLKYCDRVMKNPEKFKGDRNFLVYSQIETYLDEIYDEYYNTKKR